MPKHCLLFTLILSFYQILAVRSYDPNFACCGGCSSYQRRDGTNGKLSTGSKTFIWNTKLKTNPAPVCLLTFPYEPELNEQPGDRRVRSGRLVGRTYPIDHDFDHLCCEQRGMCKADIDDASGACHCVKKWGWTGDHCERSIYVVAKENNTYLRPEIVRLDELNTMLPDVRPEILHLNVVDAINATRMDTSSEIGTILDVTQTGTYRQYAWSPCALSVAITGIVLSLLFIVSLLKCCLQCLQRMCRGGKGAYRVYSRLTKILWGASATVCLLAAIPTLLIVYINQYPKLVALTESINNRLVQLSEDQNTFKTRLLSPLEEILFQGLNEDGLSIKELQEQSYQNLLPHTFLDNQTSDKAGVAEPLFDVLDELLQYSRLYPTSNYSDEECGNLGTTASILSRMSTGATTGCFKCQTCLQIREMIHTAKDYWFRSPVHAQMDLRNGKELLKDFSARKLVVTSTLTHLVARLQSSFDAGETSLNRTTASYSTLVREAQMIYSYGFVSLLIYNGVIPFLCTFACVHGMKTERKVFPRVVSVLAFLAFAANILLFGALYSGLFMARDVKLAIELMEENASVYISSETATEDLMHVLFDRSLYDMTKTTASMIFADTLRVPPHPTAFTDDAIRLDIPSLYSFPELLDLEALLDESTAIVSLFKWEEEYFEDERALMIQSAFGNESVISPYNESIHQLILNSTIDYLLDPNQDGTILSLNDEDYFYTTFNESWRGVDDSGEHQNHLIYSHWYYVAHLAEKKLQLEEYTAALAKNLAKIHPPLEEIKTLTFAMEEAEYQLKGPVEVLTNAIRESRIQDCSYNGNCGYFRVALNDFQVFVQKLIEGMEEMVLWTSVSPLTSLLGSLSIAAFANRLRRNIVKIYSGTHIDVEPAEDAIQI